MKKAAPSYEETFPLEVDIHPRTAYMLGTCGYCGAPTATWLGITHKEQGEKPVQYPICLPCRERFKRLTSLEEQWHFIDSITLELMRRESHWHVLYGDADAARG